MSTGGWEQRDVSPCTIPVAVRDDTTRTWPPHLFRSRKVVTLRAVRTRLRREIGFLLSKTAQNHGMAGWSMMNHSSIITAPGLTQRTSNMLLLGCVTIKLAATISFTGIHATRDKHFRETLVIRHCWGRERHRQINPKFFESDYKLGVIEVTLIGHHA